MDQSNSNFPDFSRGMVGNTTDTDMEEIKKGIKEITEALNKMNSGIDDIRAYYTTASKKENDNPNDTIEKTKQSDNTNEEVQANEFEKNNLTEEKPLGNVIEFPKSPIDIPGAPAQEDIPALVSQEGESKDFTNTTEPTEMEKEKSDVSIEIPNDAIDIPGAPAQEDIPALVSQEGESKDFTNTTEPTEMEKEKSDVSIEIPNDAIDNPTLPTLGSDANNIGQQPTIPVLNEEQNIEAAEEFKPDINIGVPTQDTTEVQNVSEEQPQNTVAPQVTEEIKQNDNAEVQPAPIENAMPVQEATIPQNTGEEQPKLADNIIDITAILNNAQNNAQVQAAAPVENTAVQVPAINETQNNVAEQQSATPNLTETQNTATEQQMPGQASNEAQNNNKDNIEKLNISLDKGAKAEDGQQRNTIIPFENHEKLKSFRTNNQIDNNAQVMTLKQAA